MQKCSAILMPSALQCLHAHNVGLGTEMPQSCGLPLRVRLCMCVGFKVWPIQTELPLFFFEVKFKHLSVSLGY